MQKLHENTLCGAEEGLGASDSEQFAASVSSASAVASSGDPCVARVRLSHVAPSSSCSLVSCCCCCCSALSSRRKKIIRSTCSAASVLRSHSPIRLAAGSGKQAKDAAGSQYPISTGSSATATAGATKPRDAGTFYWEIATPNFVCAKRRVLDAPEDEKVLSVPLIHK